MTETLQQRSEYAYERIAGDPNLTGDLTDRAAHLLLTHAQERVSTLVAQTAEMEEDAAWAFLDPRLGELRQWVRRTAKQAASAANPLATLQELLASPPANPAAAFTTPAPQPEAPPASAPQTAEPDSDAPSSPDSCDTCADRSSPPTFLQRLKNLFRK